MLSSRESRFSWGRQDRAPNAPFFRTLARKWRPTMRKPAVEQKPNATKKSAKGTAPAVWTPWLWVE